MARPRIYVQDADGKTVDGLSYHRPSGRYYRIENGKRYYYGSDKTQAIAGHRVHHQDYSNLETQVAVEWTMDGLSKSAIENLLALAVGHLPADQRELALQNADGLPSQLIDTIKTTPEQSTGVSLLTVGARWAKDKQGTIRDRTVQDCRVNWRDFCRRLKRLDVTNLDQLNKDAIRFYRDSIQQTRTRKRLAPSFGNKRFANVRAVLRYYLANYDGGISEARQAYILSAVTILQKRSGKTEDNRAISPAELFALLEACSKIRKAAENKIDEVRRELTVKHKRTAFQARTSMYQRLSGQLRQAEIRRLLAIEGRAIYFLSINCAFLPVDIATIRKANIDMSSGHVVFRRGKTGCPRVGIMLEATKEALREYLACRCDHSPFLFLNSAGGPWDSTRLGRLFRSHKKSADLTDPTLTMRTFRKGSYSAAKSDPSVDLHTAKLIAGHETGIDEEYATSAANIERIKIAVEAIGRSYDLGS